MAKLIRNTVTGDFMNPPEQEASTPVKHSPEFLEIREKLQNELEEKKKLGQQQEWYEELLKKWISKSSQLEREAIRIFLTENPVENYSDADYLKFALDDTISKEVSVTLFRLSRDIIGRKLVLDRNLPQVKQIFSRYLSNHIDPLDYGINDETDYEREGSAARTCLLADSITLTGKPETVSEEPEPFEKRLLQQTNLEAVAKCIHSGIFISENVDLYLDYILEQGALELTPLFVSLKYKNK